MILVIRIAGKAKQQTKHLETLTRLKLEKKFSARLIEETDAVRKGMVQSVSTMVAYGIVDEAFVKELQEKRPAKEGVHFLHPPLGGFKKSSKVAAPKGILGKHEDISQLARRML